MTTTISARGNLGWLVALLAAGLSAAAFGFAFTHADTLLVFAAYLAPLPLFTAGLGAGTLPGALAGFAGAAMLYLKVSPYLALSYVILNALPVAMLTLLALRYRPGTDGRIYWYPEGYLLAAGVVYPCVVFLAAALLAMGQDGGLPGQTAQLLNESMAPLMKQMEPEQAENFKIMLDVLPRILPALLGCAWFTLMVVNALGAQAMLRQQRWNLRETFSGRDIEAPAWLLPAAAVAGLLAMFGGAPYDYLGVNVSFMLCLPFFVIGLAVVHAWAARLRYGMPFLVSFYILLSLMPWLALLAALLGALDQGMHFRRRFSAHPINKETTND